MKRTFVIFAITILAAAIYWMTPQLAFTSQQRSRSQQGKSTPPAAVTPGRIIPAPSANPDLAPQADINTALYTTEEFFGTNAQVPRPYEKAREQLAGLLTKYPKDARLHLYAASLDTRLERFDKAASEMEQYVALKQNSPGALRKLAIFYHNSGQFKIQVETLQRLAKASRPAEREAIYREILSVIHDHTLKEFSPASFYKEMIAADPENVQLVKNYFEELMIKKNYPEALAVINSYQGKYPQHLQYFLKARASVYEAQNDRAKAEAVYRDAFDPLWPQAIAADYYALLRRLGRYQSYRRALQAEWTQKGNFNTVLRLFNVYAYEGNLPNAASLLVSYEAKRGTQGNWTPAELETLAGLFISIGQYDQASRYLYTLYLTGGLTPATPAREESLFRIFKVLVDAGSQPVRLSRGDLSLYQDIATIDQNPGVLNGVLSLILSGENVPNEFNNKEQSAGSYFNRAFAYRIFNSFKREYANSQKLPLMYEDLLAVFAGFGEHKLVIELGRQFQQQFPNARNYNEVAVKIADAQVALGQRQAERTVLIALLDRIANQRANGQRLLPVSRMRWSYQPTALERAAAEETQRQLESYSDVYDPSDRGSDTQYEVDPNYDTFQTPYDYLGNPVDTSDKITYSSVLERVVSSFATEKKKTETLRFFWSEIKKHPNEEGLYERMLKWLGSTDIVGEQLKVYTAAVQRFQDNTWYHRLARWYIRNKQRDAFQQYSREIVEIFDQDDINEYLQRFAALSRYNVGDVNYDSQLYFELYNYALKRFPHNLTFVQGLLRYHESRYSGGKAYSQWIGRPDWLLLSKQYYAADRTIRDKLITDLARNNELRAHYDQARKASANSIAYRLFTADAAIALSHFNEAVDTYRFLTASYPGELHFALRLGDLTRSLSYSDRKAAEESAAVYMKLARIYPTEHSYKTKAGEIFAELGDFVRARQTWDTILTPEQGISNTYLEVASIYWDYFQFDDSIRTIKLYRDSAGDQTLLAYKMGAIYEGKGKWSEAIAEYVSVLSETGEGRQTVIKRLVQLTPRRDFAQVIARNYQQRIAAQPDNWMLTLGYSDYLREAGKEGEADSLLREQVARRTEIEFLEAARDIFRRERLAQDEERVIIRLTELARDDREALKYRLQLAAFYEQRRNIDRATGIFDKLIGNYPTNLGVVQETTQYYWRVGLLDKAIDLYKQAAGRAKGDYQRQFTLQLAKRLEAANRLNEAEQTARAWYVAHPFDSEFFGLLVSVLGTMGKQDALVELYQGSLKQVAEAGLEREDAISRTIELRLAMINTLTKLNRASEVIDQYIEIINRRPEDGAIVQAAFRYGQANGQLERFTKYYEDLAKKSYKNYRWNLVLAGIYASLGDINKEAEQYRLATLNEPQRVELRELLANRYVLLQRYDEAITALRKCYEITNNDPVWLTKIATVQIQSGKPDAAIATLRESLMRNPKVTVSLRFQAGDLLATHGYSKLALQFYQEGIDAFRRDPYKEDLISQDLSNYSLALLKSFNATRTYTELNNLKSALTKASGESGENDSNRARYASEMVDGFIKQQFGRQVVEYCSPKERLELTALLRQYIQNKNDYGQSTQDELRSVASLADAAGLAELQEAVLIKLKDNAYNARTAADRSIYDAQLRTLLSFYDRYGLYTKAAETLEQEVKRLTTTYNYDYLLLADYWGKVGATERELDALRNYYRTRSGKITLNQDAAIERYLTLLADLGRRDELTELAKHSHPYQLQLINFLILRGDKNLAIAAIDHTDLSSAWRASRRAQVSLYFRDRSPAVEASFQSALFLKPIREMVGKKPDENTVLYNSDWYVTASNYGVWLQLTPERAKEARKYIIAKLEDKPQDASAQLELANFYINNKNYPLAEQHLALAGELAPTSPAILVAEGNYHFLRGDRTRALAAWNNLIAKRNAGVLQHDSYFTAMSNHGLLTEALPAVERFLTRALVKLPWTDLQPFIRKVARTGSQDMIRAHTTAQMFYRVMQDNPENRLLGAMLLNEELIVPIEDRVLLYRVMLERYADDLLAASLGNDEYNYAAESAKKQLDNHSRKFIDFLISRNELTEARRQLKFIEDSSENLYGTTTAQTEARSEWLDMARATVDLREGKVAEAVASLRRFAGLAQRQQPVTEATDRHLKAYTLLVNERQIQAADELLYDYYRNQLNEGEASIANFSGIASVELRRGRNNEGLAWLQRMVGVVGSAEAAANAGLLAARYRHYNQAFQWRERAQQLNPALRENRLELARLAVEVKRVSFGVDLLKQLIDDRETDNGLRAQAIELLPQIAKADVGVFDNLLLSLQSKTDYNSQLLYAGLLIVAQRQDEARTLLANAGTASTAAQARLMNATLQLAAKNNDAARVALQEAIYADGSAEIVARSLAFAYENPRATLLQLYAVGQPQAALALGPSVPHSFSPNQESENEEEGSQSEEEDYEIHAFNYTAADNSADRSKYLTLAEAAIERRQASDRTVLKTLVDVAIKVGDLVKAIDILAAYQEQLTAPEEIASVEQRRLQLTIQYDKLQAGRNTSLRLDNALTESVLSAQIQPVGF
ncbi:MAG: hypothetical protein AB1489_14925 [Acidobacteriota bacterium]